MPTLTTVSNTSPLFYLNCLGQIDLLPQLYGSIVIPHEVARELDRGHREGYGAPDVATLTWLTVRPVKIPKELESSDLDAGELEAVALALEISACRILLDDRAARLEAKRLGVPVTGTLGILEQAKQRGLLTAIKPSLERLTELEFRASRDLIRSLLTRTGES